VGPEPRLRRACRRRKSVVTSRPNIALTGTTYDIDGGQQIVSR
jgi:hypothetical protein